MATVNINLSQSVIDQLRALETAGTGLDTSPAGLVSQLGNLGSAATGTPVLSVSGTNVIATYPDGSTETYSRVVLDNGYSGSGHASASGYLFTQGSLTASASGQFNFDYGQADGGLWVAPSARGDLINSVSVNPGLTAGNPGYDPVFGNVTLSMQGAVTIAQSGALGGTISNISIDAEKFLSSVRLDGTFTLSPNAPGGVGGTLTGYTELYRDISSIHIQGLSADIGTVPNLGQGILDDSRYFGGADRFDVHLPSRLYAPVTIQAGAGDDLVSLAGGGGQLGVQAGEGNDRIEFVDGAAHAVDGGSGIDTIRMFATLGTASVHHSAAGANYTLIMSGNAVSQLTNVERIAFTDTTVALDIDGNGGQAYRLYQAAFNRTPDKAGVGYWINALDQGMSLDSVARNFIGSAEFQSAYGTAPGNRDLVSRFYENILHRAPEQAGLNYWTGLLDSGASNTAQVLANISESAENKLALIGVIGDGFAYTPYA